MRSLSKSRFQTGLQCPKALWLSVHRRELATPTSETQQWVFDQGSDVGRLAQQLFPGGIEVTEDHTQGARALATTERLLSEGVGVLYEPAFACAGIFARVDILVSAGDGTWDLYEVKSSTRTKDVHVTDAAVQAYAVESAGLAVRTINIVHLDSTYVYEGGAYDIPALFAIEDVTPAARTFMAHLPETVARLQAVLAGPEPQVRIGAQCSSPYACDFRSHCHAFLPAQHPVTELPRLREPQLHALLDLGVLSVFDVPADFPGLDPAQREAVDVVQSGRPLVDSEELGRSLQTLVWPVYHLDFETVNPALPLWPGTRPYEVIPFQYSVHVQYGDERVEHREYLHRTPDDPRPELARRLIGDLGTTGSVAHYTRYERTQLAALARAVPELATDIDAVIRRLFDLEPMIKNNARHPDAAGRSSIKAVLPAWCPDCSYVGLGINDGQSASVRYLRVVKGLADHGEADRTFSDLLEYCGMDTYAMVRLLSEMMRMARE